MLFSSLFNYCFLACQIVLSHLFILWRFHGTACATDCFWDWSVGHLFSSLGFLAIQVGILSKSLQNSIAYPIYIAFPSLLMNMKFHIYTGTTKKNRHVINLTSSISFLLVLMDRDLITIVNIGFLYHCAGVIEGSCQKDRQLCCMGLLSIFQSSDFGLEVLQPHLRGGATLLPCYWAEGQ